MRLAVIVLDYWRPVSIGLMLFPITQSLHAPRAIARENADDGKGDGEIGKAAHGAEQFLGITETG